MVAGAWGAEYKADEIMDQLYGAITKPKGKEKKSFAPADNITKDNIQYKLLRGLMDMAIAKKKPIPNLREGDTLISVSDVLLKLLRKILKESDEPEPKVLYRVSWLPVRDEIKRLENLGA